MVEDKATKTNWSTTSETAVCHSEKLEVDLFGSWKVLKVFEQGSDMIIALCED